MVYPPELLDRLQAVEPAAWAGRAFRHMFAANSPDRENTRGARWNPPGVAAIYASLLREGAVAEADYQLSVQPIRPHVKRTVYTLEITLESVLDLSDLDSLASLGVGPDEIAGDDMSACQGVGGAAHWLDHDGLLVPSARSNAVNLVIFPASRPADARFEVTASEALPDA